MIDSSNYFGSKIFSQIGFLFDMMMMMVDERAPSWQVMLLSVPAIPLHLQEMLIGGKINVVFMLPTIHKKKLIRQYPYVHITTQTLRHEKEYKIKKKKETEKKRNTHIAFHHLAFSSFLHNQSLYTLTKK